MGSIYAILSVLPLLLKIFEFEKDIMIFTSLHLLSKLIGLEFWWPAKETDDVYEIKHVLSRMEEQYYFGMLYISVIYITEGFQPVQSVHLLELPLRNQICTYCWSVQAIYFTLWACTVNVRYELEASHQALTANLTRNPSPNHIYLQSRISFTEIVFKELLVI